MIKHASNGIKLSLESRRNDKHRWLQLLVYIKHQLKLESFEWKISLEILQFGWVSECSSQSVLYYTLGQKTTRQHHGHNSVNRAVVGGPVMVWPLFSREKNCLSVQFKLCVTSNYTCADECRLLSFYIWTGLFRVSKPLNSWLIAPPPLYHSTSALNGRTTFQADCDPGQLLTHFQNSFAEYDTIRYDTRCYFNVRSKADISRLNLPHGTDN